MAWINVFSVSLYLTAYFAIKNRKNNIAIFLMFLEVFTHTAAGIVILGWDSGFVYYLIVFVPAISLSTSKKPALIALCGLFTFMIALRLVTYNIEAIQPIEEVALKIVHVVNLAIVFVLFTYLSLYYLKQVRKAQKKLHLLATTDSLTKLLNRRQMSILTQNEIKSSIHLHKSVCLILIDLDHFKTVNDNFGHDIGDQVLVKCSELISLQLRTTDLVSRWGGEEFLVVLPNASIDDALEKAEQIRLCIHDYDWGKNLVKGLSLSLSSGVAKVSPTETLSAAIARADRALYKSKRNGRNRVEIAADA